MIVRRSLQRGFSLLMAMIVIVLMTLLVVGAISFTGTERAAAVQQTRAETLSACTQAARNLFLSKVRVLKGNVGVSWVDAGVPIDDGGVMLIQSRHYGGPVTI